MTELKATPGPWAARFDETITVRAPDHSRVCQLTMLSASGRRDGSENEANARLIASAPELYEACAIYAEWVRKEREGPQYPEGVHRDTPKGQAIWQDWWDEQQNLCARADKLTEAALRKARGEEQ